MSVQPALPPPSPATSTPDSPRDAARPLRFNILTTFPELFDPALPGGVLNSSIPKRAREAGLVSWQATNLRQFAQGKHQKTDDRPFGGGPGMVMMAQPVLDAVTHVEAQHSTTDTPTRIFLSPQGRRLDQPLVEQLATKSSITLIAGHYEGLDERAIRHLELQEISLGDYVLSSGELAALVLMDAIIRLLPGALGDDESAIQDSFGIAKSYVGPPGTPRAQRLTIADNTRLLDCPHYTQPRVWQGLSVPDVLLSGDHGAIERWRLEQRLERTKARRPDLLA